jgi:hypothetical protein
MKFENRPQRPKESDDNIIDFIVEKRARQGASPESPELLTQKTELSATIREGFKNIVNQSKEQTEKINALIRARGYSPSAPPPSFEELGQQYELHLLNMVDSASSSDELRLVRRTFEESEQGLKSSLDAQRKVIDAS